MTEQADILFEIQDKLALVTLNRPQAMNALSTEMCLALDARLAAWEHDPAIQAVMIQGSGSRAFCTGGDIRRLYEEGRQGRPYPFEFFRAEYRMNARIRRFPKPYVAFLDGAVMGGGVGISAHGSHRITTENTLFAMPETGIGLFPDIGASYLLSRAPGESGMYLALTGARLRAADMIYVGVASHHMPAAARDEITAAVRAAAMTADPRAAVEAAIAKLATDPGPAPLAAHRAVIDRNFCHPSVEAVLAALDRDGDGFAAEAAATIRQKSPTSLKVTLREIAGARKIESFDDCMRIEWRLAAHCMRGHDFYEGTRAQVVDKDRNPKWQPAALSEVSEANIAAYFAPPPEGELIFDWDAK